MRGAIIGAIVGLSLLVAAPGAAHQTPGSTAPITACEGVDQAGDCQYLDHHRNRYRGTCRDFGGRLMCVRNQPIEPPIAEVATPEHPPRPGGSLAVAVSLVAAGAGLLALGVWTTRRLGPPR